MEKIILNWENESGSIRKWQISKNKEVLKNQALAACVINKKVQTLYSTTDGRVEKIFIQDGEEFKAGYVNRSY
jgi:pyruvate carboxylase